MRNSLTEAELVKHSQKRDGKSFKKLWTISAMQIYRTLYKASLSMNTQDAPLRCSELLMVFRGKLIIHPKIDSETLAYSVDDTFKL